MFFYSDGVNEWTIQYGNSSGDLTVPQQEQIEMNPQGYTATKIEIFPDNPVQGGTEFEITFPEEERQWVDDEGEWVDGYRDWANRMEKVQAGAGWPDLIKDLIADVPKKGEQLEFDFVRQMGI